MRVAPPGTAAGGTGRAGTAFAGSAGASFAITTPERCLPARPTPHSSTQYTTSVAVADQDDGIRFKDPLINAYAALAKIEANLGEASAKLYLHAALPASSNERKKLAKQMLNAMMLDKEGQIKMFTATGAPPPICTLPTMTGRVSRRW